MTETPQEIPEFEPDTTPRRVRPTRTKTTPKPPSSQAALNREVDAAARVMTNFYELATFGLMFVSPDAAGILAKKTDELDASNRKAFEADPRLRAAIARAGSISGTGTFIVTNAMVLIPVAFVAASDMRKRRPEKSATTPSDNASAYANSSFFEE